MADFPPVLSEDLAGQLLGISVKTLRNWRCERRGPAARRISGRVVVYLLKDVLSWVERVEPFMEPIPAPPRRGRPRKLVRAA
jgi:predicted DNA-binding transcriptional regulator AlpA